MENFIPVSKEEYDELRQVKVFFELLLSEQASYQRDHMLDVMRQRLGMVSEDAAQEGPAGSVSGGADRQLPEAVRRG